MRILAIRGCNLASLAGEFEIDFHAEPLQSAGLFAISGPTGAGKSTLLDALCLALYEATPRLARAGARGIALPDVKEETVTPQDVRNLLRRGAAEGHAEVDFVGNDGLVYRARWSVRRARNRSDGRLQDSEMRLWRLPELQPLGGRNAEVKAEIVRRVGLNFDQFTRAVLLAQNEFSAFLKANDNERGELLETLTGSAVYSEISRLAFERAREETAALEKLSERLEHALPLPDEERRQLEAQADAARLRLSALEAAHAALERQLAWQREARALAAAFEDAAKTRDSQRAAWQQASDRRTHLAELEMAQPAQALLAESQRLCAEIERCRAAIAECEQRLEKANASHLAAARAHEQAAQAWQATQTDHANKQARLVQARAIDARIDALLPEHAQRRRHAEDAAAAAGAARAALESRTLERTTLAAQLAGLESWLGSRETDAALAGQWQRCDMLLTQAREHARQATQAAGIAAAAVIAQQHGEGVEREHADAHGVAVATLEQRRSERDACADKLRALEAERIPGARARLAQEQQQLIEAERLCRSLHETQLRRTEALADMMRQADTLAAAQRGWEAAQSAQAGIAAALAQAERSQKRAEAASSASVEQLRAGLTEGEPCPVCGAHEHPYRHEDPRMRAMLEALALEVAVCRKAALRNTEDQATHKALADTALAAQQEAERRIAEHDAALEETAQAWSRHALHGSDAALTAPPHACAAWLAQRQAAIAARIRDIDTAEQAYATAAAERDRAQAALDAAAARLEDCRTLLDRTRNSNAEAARALIAARERERDAHARLDASLDALDALPLPRDWRAAWHADPDALHARCRDSVVAWETQQAQRNAILVRCGALDAELQSSSERCTLAEAERERAAAALAEREKDLQGLRQERAGLFDGRPASEVEAEIGAQLAACRNALDAAIAEVQRGALDVTRCTESRDSSRERLTQLLEQAQESARRIATWLADHNAQQERQMDAERLRALLAHEPDWIRTERSALSALDAALGEAEAVCSERERRCAAHAGSRDAAWPDMTESAVEEALQALRGERQQAQSEYGSLQLSLSADDRRRADATEMRQQLEAQQAVQRRWAQLSELIGSADGKKFRNYAQQTTLDVLLAYANRHLAELSRRYRLERVRDTLALLVIDGDMGEEIRSVHSLSGGESFLVSLALALGLASLSSNGVRVESLFIDEGFGSLDADTLRVAMDALDGLQAMGRKVGVISHVQEMTERIATRILVKRVSGGSSQVSVKAQ